MNDQPVGVGNDRTQQSLQEAINQRLVESGERERLKQLLRERLIECGWRDELKERCKRVVKERGFENVTADGLAKEIAPHVDAWDEAADTLAVPAGVATTALAAVDRWLAGGGLLEAARA